jgi:hypothetical protein
LPAGFVSMRPTDRKWLRRAATIESQDKMIAQAEHGAPDEADVEGFWPDWIWTK